MVYLTYDGLTDSLGQSQIIPYVLGLSKLGHSFTIVSFEKKDRYLQSGKDVRGNLESNNIEWVALSYTKYPPVLSTVWDIARLWRALKQINRQHSIDIVHCRSYITALVGLRAKRKLGIKFLFDMRGFWADERVEGGLWSLGNPFYRIIYSFFKRKEKLFLSEADHTISLTQNARTEILSWRLNDSPITVIPTCVDVDFFSRDRVDGETQQTFRSKLGLLPSDFVLLYLGSWGTWYLTDEMLKFFNEVKKIKPQAKFLIVSPGTIDLSNYPYKNDVEVTRASRNEVPVYISIADLAIFFIKPSFSKKASSATKLGELLAMQVPVVTNTGWGDVALNNFNGWVQYADPNHPEAFSWSFDKPAQPPNLTELSLPSGVSKYNQVYQTIMERTTIL